MLLETAAVGVTAPAEQMAAASLVGHDEAPMTHGASAARGDALDAVQSVPLPAGGSVSRALQERDVPGDTGPLSLSSYGGQTHTRAQL